MHILVKIKHQRAVPHAGGAPAALTVDIAASEGAVVPTAHLGVTTTFPGKYPLSSVPVHPRTRARQF